MTPLEAFAAETGGPVLVLHDAGSVAATTGLSDPQHVVRPADQAVAGKEPWSGVALVVTDRAELRRTAAALPALGDTAAVACLMTRERRPAHLVARPEWPRPVRLTSERLPAGGALTVVQLDGSMAAEVVLQELARLAAPALSAPLTDLGTVPGARTEILPEAARVADPLLERGPLDEGVLNPIGFDPHPSEGVAVLSAAGPAGLRLEGVEGVDLLDPSRGPGTDVVTALRAHRGVRVSWDADPAELARTVAGLAMCGVPVTGEPPPADSRRWLGEALHTALGDPADLSDPLRREEHSVTLRRAAMLTHSVPSWRATVARATGRPAPRFPTCSIVLATRRPDQLDFALRQVARQRSVDVELVVVAHGFDPDRSRVRDQLDDRPVEVLSLPASALFGEVLNAGVAAASGELVVKMDDDDWYGPCFLLDLMLAREYSGADVVGTTAELVYLEQLDRTVRTRATSERFARLVAGGTMALPRGLLHALGGFRPVTRFVDRQLLHAAGAAGVAVYRGHGLGYLLRRSAGGHTWDPGIDFFLDDDRVVEQWPGFAPSLLLDVDAVDLPAAAPTPGSTP